jgi:hypothetical protein
MLEAAAILERIDRCIRELEAIRSELVASMPAPASNGTDGADDFAPYRQIDAASAAQRFGLAQDRLRSWARETQGTEQAVAIRQGGRWVFSICRLQRRCGLEP